MSDNEEIKSKKAYFRKIKKNSRLIIVVEDGNHSDIKKMERFLKEYSDFVFLVCDGRYKFIEVTKDAAIEVLPIEKYPKEKSWWRNLFNV